MSYRSFSLIVMAVIGLGSAASHAAAADLDPGYAQVPRLQEEKVEFGSGWYIRGDMGIEQDYVLQLYVPPNSNYYDQTFKRNHNPGYVFGLGGGYQFTSNVRTDITGDLHQPSTFDSKLTSYCLNSMSQTCDIVGSFRNYNALFNIYYDIGRWRSITPYIGAGAGVAFGDIITTLSGGTTTYGGNTGYHTFAFALMAGISVDVFDHTKLDIGYRYLNSGHFEGTNLYNHQLRAGLRYMIDN